MSRFFLHVRTPSFDALDEEGLELPCLDAAKEKAIEGIRSILAAELVEVGRLSMRGQIEVADESGSSVATIPFDEVVHIVQ